MASTAHDEREDPTVYPVTDEMGEGSLQRFISELLRALIVTHLAGEGRRAFVGANQFIYYEQHNSKACVAPDVYVLEGVDPGIEIGAWKVWEAGVRPCFALEVVSGDVYKDYVEVIRRYEALQPREVVIFDPKSGESADRVRWQVWRTVRRRFTQVEVSDADRVRSEALGCWLRSVGTGPATRVRLGVGPEGAQLVPTAEERAETERQRAEAERQRAEASERELESLRAELDRLRKG